MCIGYLNPEIGKGKHILFNINILLPVFSLFICFLKNYLKNTANIKYYLPEEVLTAQGYIAFQKYLSCKFVFLRQDTK